MSDQILRDAARLLRAGAPLTEFVAALNSPTRERLRMHLLDTCARVGCGELGKEWENGHRMCQEHAQDYRDRIASLRHHGLQS